LAKMKGRWQAAWPFCLPYPHRLAFGRLCL
jgi:hypothetical protein